MLYVLDTTILFTVLTYENFCAVQIAGRSVFRNPTRAVTRYLVLYCTVLRIRKKIQVMLRKRQTDAKNFTSRLCR